MKFFNNSLILLTLALVCTLCVAQDKPQPKRSELVRRPTAKGAKATTTTPAPPPEQNEGEEGDYPDEGQEQYGDEAEDQGSSSTTTTSTEPPKKVGPVIRPFRSNDDLLNSLKRRQMNAKKNKIERPTPKSKPVQSEDQQDEEQAANSAPAPAKTFKSNAAANRRKFTKPGRSEQPVEDVATAESEQPRDETKIKRPSPFSSLRRRN